MKKNVIDMDHYLKDLEEIVNIDSWSKDPEGVSQVANVLAEKFEKSGFNIKFLNFGDQIGPCLEVTNSDSEEIDLLLIGHIDTVFPQGTVKERPFSMNEKLAMGPGVADMKSGVLLGYYVMKEIDHLASSDNNKLRICMAINSDEEIGSRASKAWLEELAKKSKYVLVLEAGEEGGSILDQRKGIAAYEINFKGIPAHAGIEPEKGRSAIGELGHWIVKLHSLTNLEIGTSVNVGIVSGGTVSNVIAQDASARVDLRYLRKSEKERIEGIMQEMTENPFIDGVKINFKCLGMRPPMTPNEETHKLCAMIEQIGKDIDMEINWVCNGGGSDANFVSAIGVPVLDGLGPVGGYCHGKKEYIEIDSINSRFKLLVELCLRLQKEKDL